MKTARRYSFLKFLISTIKSFNRINKLQITNILSHNF